MRERGREKESERETERERERERVRERQREREIRDRLLHGCAAASGLYAINTQKMAMRCPVARPTASSPTGRSLTLILNIKAEEH